MTKTSKITITLPDTVRADLEKLQDAYNCSASCMFRFAFMAFAKYHNEVGIEEAQEELFAPIYPGRRPKKRRKE